MNNFYLSKDEAIALYWNLRWTIADIELSDDDEQMLRAIISRIDKLLEKE